MIYYDNGGRCVESTLELFHFPHRIVNLYLDFETTSRNPKLDSFNPWDVAHCGIAGACITYDDCLYSWYVPWDILEKSQVWFRDLLDCSQRWINHNIKYDYHVLANNLGYLFAGELVDTVTLAKILDSDRTYKGGYSLDALSKAWLHEDLAKQAHLIKPYLHASKDFGDIPVDILGEYGCSDVVATRALYKYLCDNLPEECEPLVTTEIQLTRVLVDIEHYGLRTNSLELKKRILKSTVRLMESEKQLHMAVGREFNPISNKDCHDVLCNQYGLPVLSRTKDGNPSFTHDALEDYKQIKTGAVPENVLDLIITCRKESTLKGLFWEPWLQLQVNEILHSDYNQSVRSGRMSCRNPNAQQLNTTAKECIYPREGYSILSIDYSQIEYRLIVHYIQDAKGIAAYAENPDIDFHQWVADLCGIDRRPAKTMNFMLGFGGGREKTVALLSHMVDPLKTPNVFRAANTIYDTYHANLPGLKRVSGHAARVARRRGYVFNAYGRRLHLPQDRCHIAFNRIVQSTAADVAKERAVAVASRLAGEDARLVAIVHDEFVFEVPTGTEERWADVLVGILEDTAVKFRVPIRANASWSAVSWAGCKDSPKSPEPVSF